MARPQDKGKAREKRFEAPVSSFPAKVVEIIRRTGATGEISQVRCEVLDGRDQGRVLRRNVKGPIRIGDVLMLKQTFMDAGEIRRI